MNTTQIGNVKVLLCQLVDAMGAPMAVLVCMSAPWMITFFWRRSLHFMKDSVAVADARAEIAAIRILSSNRLGIASGEEFGQVAGWSGPAMAIRDATWPRKYSASAEVPAPVFAATFSCPLFVQAS